MPDWIWVQNALLPVLGMALGALVLFGVYRTVNRHLDRKHDLRVSGGGSEVVGEVVGEVARLRERVEALEDHSFRMQELEERVDFAERVLARQQDKPVLGGEH